jgi:ankyrin repeat protein
MLNTNGVGADIAEQNSHDTGRDLFQAGSSGNALIAQPLLSAIGAQSYINYTDGDGCTPLFKTASHGYAVIVAQLMTASCSINLATTKGLTPLLVADRVSEGHTNIVSHLITARCNVDIALNTDGATPLFIAAKKGHATIVAHLIVDRS